MKERQIIKVMVVILAISIIHLGVTKLSHRHAVKTKESVQVLKIMSEMENQIAYEAHLKALALKNETTSCNVELLDLPTKEELPYDLTEDMLDQYYEKKNNDSKPSSSNKGSIIEDTNNSNLPEYSKKYPELYVEHYVPEVCDTNRKVAYLTFDDGPSCNTTKILDILEQKGAVATFFVLGSTMNEEGEADLKRMVDMGCGIGIHTYSHERNIIYSSIDGFLKDFNEVYLQVYEITGVKPCIFRFPWGSYNRYSKGIKNDLIKEMERRGFTYFDWNVSAEDSVGKPSAYSIRKNVMKDVKRYNRPVILMHDSMINTITVETLPSIIDELKKMGYEFDTLLHREPCQFCW